MYTAIVIRPGETEFDREDRIQGSLDLPLTPDGRRQVADVIDQLRSEPLDVIYASPSQPARATAELISDALGVPLKELDGLANMDQGLWQGMLLSDLKRKNTESIAYRHDQDRKDLQHFIGQSNWDHQPLIRELARQVGGELGRGDAVL